MNRHVASLHEGKKPFNCELCDYSSSVKSSMNKHIASVHEGKKPFKCEYCDYSSSMRSTMNQHVALVVDYIMVDCQAFEKFENAIFFKIFKIPSNGQLV